MRVVVKIGTSSLTDDAGGLRSGAVASAVAEIAAVRSAGHEVLFVTSGAVATGMAGMGLAARPSDVGSLHALAAVGQPRLMAAYIEAFGAHGLVPAQVLLVPHDFVDRRQYLHARATIDRLLEMGCVPVINENDAIASTAIRFGDNDRVAALVAQLAGADLLVLLTDTDGLRTEDPRVNPDAPAVRVVRADDPLLSVDATSRGSDRGSGGMASKLAAARIASWSGVTAVIADASGVGAIDAAVRGDTSRGTRFEPHERHLSARKLWIAFASEVEGSVTVDPGARRALVERGASLLPAGVVGCAGDFDTGATVAVLDVAGGVVARGMVSMSSAQVSSVLGRRSGDLDESMPRTVVHRDDLVVML